jgi:dTMP kinase
LAATKPTAVAISVVVKSAQGARVTGRFFVVEGADAVGSTTQVHLLVQRLQQEGRDAVATAEPSRGPIGLMLRELLQAGRHDTPHLHAQMALLFAADRLDHIDREVAPLLARGVDVVSDRYVLSSLVYQSLHLPVAHVRTLNAHAPTPTKTVLVTLGVEEAQARLQQRAAAQGTPAERFDSLEVQRAVHERYAQLAPEVGAVIVDGRGAPKEVHARVWAACQ